jgi:DNA-binding transcriptional LysR family regulator
MAYSAILQELFGSRGLVVNSVIGFDNATFARAMVQGGAGLTLVRREHAVEGERAGQMAVSPLVQAEYPLCIAHLASRRNDPLVRAFVEAAARVWPAMRVISSASALRAG